MRETRTVLPAEFEIVAAASGVQPLVISVTGQPGTGKTRLAATAPGDIAVLATHRKVFPTLTAVAPKFGRTVVRPKEWETFFRSSNPMKHQAMDAVCDAEKLKVDPDKPQPTCCTKHAARWTADREKRAMIRMMQLPNVRTGVIDSGTHLYEDIIFACYGRDEKIMPLDRKVANKEMREFLEALTATGKNLIVTHEAQEIWEEYGPVIDAKGNRKSRPTGKFKPSGWKHIGYFVSIELEAVVDTDAAPGEGRYKLNTKLCQENAAIVGVEGLLYDGAITFQNIACKVWPDIPEETWE